MSSFVLLHTFLEFAHSIIFIGSVDFVPMKSFVGESKFLTLVGQNLIVLLVSALIKDVVGFPNHRLVAGSTVAYWCRIFARIVIGFCRKFPWSQVRFQSCSLHFCVPDSNI